MPTELPAWAIEEARIIDSEASDDDLQERTAAALVAAFERGANESLVDGVKTMSTWAQRAEAAEARVEALERDLQEHDEWRASELHEQDALRAELAELRKSSE